MLRECCFVGYESQGVNILNQGRKGSTTDWPAVKAWAAAYLLRHRLHHPRAPLSTQASPWPESCYLPKNHLIAASFMLYLLTKKDLFLILKVVTVCHIQSLTFYFFYLKHASSSLPRLTFPCQSGYFSFTLQTLMQTTSKPLVPHPQSGPRFPLPWLLACHNCCDKAWQTRLTATQFISQLCRFLRFLRGVSLD